MEMKSLLVYTTQYMQTGGIESHLREFCKQLSEHGVRIDFVVLNSLMSPEDEAFFIKICNRTYFGKNGRSSLRLAWLIKTGMRISLNKYDAVYTNGQGDSIGLFKKLVRTKGPWVHHHHTAGDSHDQSKWSPGYIKILEAADHVIACSTRNAGDMHIVLQREVDTIPCFSREILIEDSTREPGSKIRLGYYGRLIPEKGIDTICEMSADIRMADLEFHIWGEGVAYPAAFFDKYPSVNYHGPFKGLEGLRDTIASIDAFLLLSVHPEGLPICLLEAMGAGLPWLATDVGGIRDIVVDPLSTRVIAMDTGYAERSTAVLNFAKDIERGEVTGINQKNQYQKKFSAAALTAAWKKKLELVKKN